MSYMKMWYKHGTGSFGIRRSRGDKKQIFAVSCRGATQEQLAAVADKCLEMLGTCEEEEVKAWAKDAVKKMEVAKAEADKADDAIAAAAFQRVLARKAAL